jgi:hypothetical protein
MLGLDSPISIPICLASVPYDALIPILPVNPTRSANTVAVAARPGAE